MEDIDSLIISLYKNGKSIRQIEREIKVPKTKVNTILNEHKIKMRHSQKGKIDKDYLLKEYIHNKKSTYQIANECYRSQSVVLYWLKKHDIPSKKFIDYPHPMLGRKHSEESKNQISLKLSGKNHPFFGKNRPIHSFKMRKENHPNWKGGITSKNNKLRNDNWKLLKLWRESIFKRDNYTCQRCGKRGGDLEADHISPISKSPILVLNKNNGQTLCKICHRKKTNNSIKGVEEAYPIDEETMEMCKALEFYDIYGHFPFEKKRVLITLSYDSVDKLKSIKNKSALIDSLIKQALISDQ